MQENKSSGRLYDNTMNHNMSLKMATDEHITEVKLQTALSENNCVRLSTYSHTQTSRPRVTREIN
jgi:hypothetical protein